MATCFLLRTVLKMLNIMDLSFGIITKLMVLRANREVLRIQDESLWYFFDCVQFISRVYPGPW